MMASPTVSDQDMVGNLYRQLSDFFDGKSYQPYIAPLDIRLFYQADEGDKTVVQPDLMVICDRSKLENDAFCKGAPDLVIEVVSPSTKFIDLVNKLNKYKLAGVREYWVVLKSSVVRYVFPSVDAIADNCKTVIRFGSGDRTVSSVIFPGLCLDFIRAYAF
jgi:Uma2 family endonuclease